MKATELFQRMSPGLASEIFAYLSEGNKAVYRATIESLAAQRKLRAVFVQRKPRAERDAWMQTALGRKMSETLAPRLLHGWLVGAQSKLLCEFLDALAIEHDGEGGIETLPPSPPKEKLQESIDGLLRTRPPETVAVYLHAFQDMDIAGWTPLQEILEGDPRLRLGERSVPVTEQ